MFLLPQISQIYTDFRPVRSLFLGIILFSHRFHRFTQILDLFGLCFLGLYFFPTDFTDLHRF